jgi:hypothetical protein
MRTALLSLVVVALAACSDASEPSAPVQPHAVSADRSAPAAVNVSSQAKPTAPVGFTKVTEVSSGFVNLAPGESASVSATCPAGTTAISGGYTLHTFVANATPPFITNLGSNGSNGWFVTVYDTPIGASNLTVGAYVMCAS